MQPSLVHQAQFGQDELLAEIFSEQSTEVRQIAGAFDGVIGSATCAFELRGWRSILVAPQPEFAAKIRVTRRERLCSVAAGDCNCYAQLKPQTDPAHTKAKPTGLLTVRDSNHTCVPMRRIDSILEEREVHSVDFAKIDVKGYELSVSRDWSQGRRNPRVLILADRSRRQIRQFPTISRVEVIGVSGAGESRLSCSQRGPLTTASACAGQRWSRRLRAPVRSMLPQALKLIVRRVRLARE